VSRRLVWLSGTTSKITAPESEARARRPARDDGSFEQMGAEVGYNPGAVVEQRIEELGLLEIVLERITRLRAPPAPLAA
jgi:hypothetical protein